mmetsp:Transcript_81084/g.175279  ORF Transcript_81084/g.175279 Transcript_81084/m.175279 type:complete len:298 (+) Transcript_81084:1258-2151(+)
MVPDLHETVPQLLPPLAVRRAYFFTFVVEFLEVAAQEHVFLVRVEVSVTKLVFVPIHFFVAVFDMISLLGEFGIGGFSIWVARVTFVLKLLFEVLFGSEQLFVGFAGVHECVAVAVTVSHVDVLLALVVGLQPLLQHAPQFARKDVVFVSLVQLTGVALLSIRPQTLQTGSQTFGADGIAAEGVQLVFGEYVFLHGHEFLGVGRLYCVESVATQELFAVEAGFVQSLLGHPVVYVRVHPLLVRLYKRFLLLDHVLHGELAPALAPSACVFKQIKVDRFRILQLSSRFRVNPDSVCEM